MASRKKFAQPVQLQRVKRQIFVAYPYRHYANRAKDYRDAFSSVEKAFKVKFVYADEKMTNLHILDKIRGLIQSSEFGIYDITAWNANVALELGMALGLGEDAYIAFNPDEKSSEADVPADLRGYDRVQYRQFSELREGLAKLIAQHLPVAAETLDNPLEPLQKKVLQLFKGPSARLSRSEIATAVGVSPDMARLIAETMLDTHLERTGSRGGARYARIKKVGRPRKFQPTRSRRKSKK